MPQIPGPVVLLVEDDDQVRVLFTSALASAGFQVLAAESGEAAFVVAQTHHIDVLVTDVVLPNADGFQTANRVRALAPHVPVIFMSGYTGEAFAATPEMALSVLRKPFPIAVLLDRLRRVLHAGPP